MKHKKWWLLAPLIAVVAGAAMYVGTRRSTLHLAAYERSVAEVIAGDWFVPKGDGFKAMGDELFADLIERCRDVESVALRGTLFADLPDDEHAQLPGLQSCFDSSGSGDRSFLVNPRVRLALSKSDVPNAALRLSDRALTKLGNPKPLLFVADFETSARTLIPVANKTATVTAYAPNFSSGRRIQSLQEVVNSGGIVFSVSGLTPSEVAHLGRVPLSRRAAVAGKDVNWVQFSRDSDGATKQQGSANRLLVAWRQEFQGESVFIEALTDGVHIDLARILPLIEHACLVANFGACP